MQETVTNLKNSTESSWGGTRVGAGRKPRLDYEARAEFYNAVDDRLPKIWEILDLHIRRGDKTVLLWLLEQRLGKAPQSIDMTAKTVNFHTSNNKKVDANGIDILEIANGVSAQLKLLKTRQL